MRVMTVARGFALIFGLVYVVVGLLGFIKPLTDAPGSGLFLGGEDAKLLGIFAVNWFHNLAHLAIGLLGLAAAQRMDLARVYAQAIGLAYALLFVIGLFTGDFLGVLPLNGADNVLHLLSAIVALVVGFSPVGERTLGQPRPAGAV